MLPFGTTADSPSIRAIPAGLEATAVLVPTCAPVAMLNFRNDGVVASTIRARLLGMSTHAPLIVEEVRVAVAVNAKLTNRIPCSLPW